MVLKIDGTDIMQYIEAGGLKWSRSDLESSSAGRTLDGLMHRGRVATKLRYDIKCRPLTSEETSVLLNLIYPEYVTVEVDDPQFGHVIKTFYANNNSCTLETIYDDETGLWSGIEFPLVER